MTLTKEDRGKIAEQLWQAHERVAPIKLISTKYKGMSLKDAYQIQFSLVELMKEAGGKVIGMKVGFSNPQVQKQFGLKEPMFGHLVEPLKGLSKTGVRFNSFIRPMVEPEVAFVLGEDLVGPGVNEASVLAATRGVMPALELVDLRYGNAPSKVTDTAACNVFSSGLVLGHRLSPIVGLDLRTLGLVLEINGEVVDTAAGAAVLDNPILSVVWLANKLAQFGRSLKKGQVIITGSFTKPYPVKKGQRVRALFHQIGEVSTNFI